MMTGFLPKKQSTGIYVNLLQFPCQIEFQSFIHEAS